MRREQKFGGSMPRSANFPNAGQMAEAQRTATENVAKLATTAFDYGVSLSRAWIDLWDSRYTEYIMIPKRLANAQSAFLERALDDYQQSLETLRDLAVRAQDKASSVMQETETEARRFGRQFRPEAPIDEDRDEGQYRRGDREEERSRFESGRGERGRFRARRFEEEERPARFRTESNARSRYPDYEEQEI